jgi:hypothetical protein
MPSFKKKDNFNYGKIMTTNRGGQAALAKIVVHKRSGCCHIKVRALGMQQHECLFLK